MKSCNCCSARESFDVRHVLLCFWWLWCHFFVQFLLVLCGGFRVIILPFRFSHFFLPIVTICPSVRRACSFFFVCRFCFIFTYRKTRFTFQNCFLIRLRTLFYTSSIIYLAFELEWTNGYDAIILLCMFILLLPCFLLIGTHCLFSVFNLVFLFLDKFLASFDVLITQNVLFSAHMWALSAGNCLVSVKFRNLVRKVFVSHGLIHWTH